MNSNEDVCGLLCDPGRAATPNQRRNTQNLRWEVMKGRNQEVAKVTSLP